MIETIDTVRLNFSPESLWVMNLSLSFIMFVVALELKINHFKHLSTQPRAVIIGILSQFILLPLLTFLLILLIKPGASIALGMILVAACPGGNISNFISLLAKGNAALSVCLTAIATLLCILLTPFNFALYGGLYPPASDLLTKISIHPLDVFEVILLLLGIPLILGMLFNYYFPKITRKVLPPFKVISILFFLGFIVVAFYNNYGYFLQFVGLVFLIVLIHNGLALASGFGIAHLVGLEKKERKTISIETGIQNSGLGLILIFNFFDGLGGMAIVAAWWGIWHIIAGLSIALIWSKWK